MPRATATILIAAVALPASAMAQSPPPSISSASVPASISLSDPSDPPAPPWWTGEPAASVGDIRSPISTNSIRFYAMFQSIDRSAADAQRKAMDQVRALSRVLEACGVENVRVQPTLSARRLREPSRDENGVLRDNVGSDGIGRYQADAEVSVTVQDARVLEEVYAAVLAAGPTDVSGLLFAQDSEHATPTWREGEAIKDAAARARAAAANAGASIGEFKVIDSTGRACVVDGLGCA